MRLGFAKQTRVGNAANEIKLGQQMKSKQFGENKCSGTLPLICGIEALELRGGKAVTCSCFCWVR